MSKRSDQVASEIHRAVQTVLNRGLQDPRVSGALLTATDVRVSDDLRNATVMISVMPESSEDLVMHGLQSASRHIRRQVGNLIAIRQMPDLAFKLDKSVKKQAEVLEAIARATAEREAAEKARAAAENPWQSAPSPADDADSESSGPSA